MRASEKLFKLVIILLCISFSSCKDEESQEQKELKTNKYVAHWIYDQMSLYYLWNDYLPANPDYNLKPNDFFNSICYWYDKNTNPDGDRFSWIQENYVDLMNMLNGISSDEIGFEFYLYLTKNRNVIGEIQYVKKNTPAQQAGIRRGQFFSKINGTLLNESNYYNVLINLKGSYSITLHDDINVDEENNMHLINSTEKTLSTVSKYEDYPIFLDTVYSINNKTIGYLVYNFFADDPNNGSKKYDMDLANIFSKFQQKNIDNLIVDLRYNSGGSVQASICLASILVKNRSAKNVFLRAGYNSILTKEIIYQHKEDEIYSYFTDTIISRQTLLPNIGNNLQKLVFLTGPHTASASEMVINGIKPYMDITLIGDTTVGKNVGSITIYDERNTKKNKWGIQPIIAKLYNSMNQSDFTAGFIPDILDQDRYHPKYELGDLNEGLLKNAIEYITGNQYATLKGFKEKPQMASLRTIDSSISRKKWTNKIIMPANSLPKLE